MDSIIISVRLSNGVSEYDVEVSPNIPCRELAIQIADAIRVKDISITQYIGVNPYISTSDGRRLPEDTTLGAMGLWDGSIIVLRGESS